MNSLGMQQRTPLDIGEEYPGYGFPLGGKLPKIDFAALPIDTSIPSRDFSDYPALPSPEFASRVIDLTRSQTPTGPYHSPFPEVLVGRQPSSLL